MDGAGISALGPRVGLSGLPDPMGDATAQLEARRRQQVEGAGYDPDKGLYDRYSEMLGFLGPTIAERSRAAADAMRRGDMATYQKLATDLSMDFGSFLGSIKPIRAYHGSPHDFDRFSMDKVGTGEGNQTYGHGLYFAGNEDVAQQYRRNLAMRYDGRSVQDIDKAIEEVKRTMQGPLRGRALQGLEAQRVMAVEASRVPAGRMYEVNIHADPERFLDWDKPMAEQGDAVRAALARTAWGDQGATARDLLDVVVPGEHAYKRLISGSGGTALPGFSRQPQAISASETLREAGIPGIKYLDQGSRAAGNGSRNYVVFDDKLIEILRKYGIMAPVAGAGIGSLYMGDEEGM